MKNKKPVEKTPDDEIPFERNFLEYHIQKNIYRCTPSELGEQNARRVLIDLELARFEIQAKNILAERAKSEAEQNSRVQNLKNRLPKG